MHAKPGSDPSRRGLVLTGADGTQFTFVACEQRTAIAWIWMESIDMMLASRPNVTVQARLAESGHSLKKLVSHCHCRNQYPIQVLVQIAWQ